MKDYLIAASRGRGEDNIQQLEVNDMANSITTVVKDNWVLEKTEENL